MSHDILFTDNASTQTFHLFRLEFAAKGPNLLWMPVQVVPEAFAARSHPTLQQQVVAGPGLRTSAAIPLLTPSRSNLDTSSAETAKLAPFPRDLGRRQQAKPTVQSIPGASYLGCWVDSSSRVVGAVVTPTNEMTPASCRDLCFSRSYSVFGVEAGNWCLCDSTLSSWAVKTTEADCSTACIGNAAVVCGAFWRINVYSQTSLSSPTSSSTLTPPSINVTSTLPPPNFSSVSTLTIQLPSSSSSSSSNVTVMGMSAGEIAGITIGAVIGGAVVAILAIYLFFILRRKRKSTAVHNQQLSHSPEEQVVSNLDPPQELPGVAAAQELPGVAAAQELPAN